jgi:hypothetical protein
MMPLPLRMACPMGWNRSILSSASITLVSSTSTSRKAVMLTELYLKSSRSKVSISCRRKEKFEISCCRSGEYEMAVFWVVAPCSLVEVYQRFRGSYCLHHQGGE